LESVTLTFAEPWSARAADPSRVSMTSSEERRSP
jgi:hypothetical protein